MSRLANNPDNFPLAVQNMCRQMARSMRMEDAYFDSLFKPGFALLDPALSRPFEAMTRHLANSMLAYDAFSDGMAVHVDVAEKNGAYQVQADLPGVKKEDINVSLEGNVVTIKAHTQGTSEKKNGKMLFNERHYGEISRSFTLDQEVDESKAKGKYADGVLTLELPKKADQPKIEAKTIAIQ